MEGPYHPVAVGHCKVLGFHLKGDGKPLEGFELLCKVILLMFYKDPSGNYEDQQSAKGELSPQGDQLEGYCSDPGVRTKLVAGSTKCLDLRYIVKVDSKDLLKYLKSNKRKIVKGNFKSFHLSIQMTGGTYDIDGEE